MKYDKKPTQLVATLATRIFCTQIRKIEVWKSDEIDIDRVETFCVDSAFRILEKCRQFGGDENGED